MPRRSATSQQRCASGRRSRSARCSTTPASPSSSSVLDAVPEDDDVAVEHQLPRRRQRHAGVPADPRRAGRRRDRQHLERLRSRRHAHPECLLLSEVRRPRLHRLAAPGVARHRRHRHQRAPRRHQHQHRAQRPVPQGSRGPRPHAGADGQGVRRHHDDAARQGRRDHPSRRGGRERRESSSAPTPTCSTPWRALAPTHYYDVLGRLQAVLRKRAAS